MCSVSRYLVSDNIATLLQYWISGSKSAGIWTDITTTLLILISTLILLNPIRTEFRETRIYKRLCVRKENEEDDTKHFTTMEDNIVRT